MTYGGLAPFHILKAKSNPQVACASRPVSNCVCGALFPTLPSSVCLCFIILRGKSLARAQTFLSLDKNVLGAERRTPTPLQGTGSTTACPLQLAASVLL